MFDKDYFDIEIKVGDYCHISRKCRGYINI